MSRLRVRNGKWLAALVALAAAAAHSAPEGAATARAARAYPVKPAGPIALDYRMGGDVAVGVPVEITITATLGAATTEPVLEARGGDPEALFVGTPRRVGGAAGRAVFVLSVTPLASRPSYLDVVVSTEQDGMPQSRALVVPIRPAAAAAPRPPRSSATAGGEALILLPVEEGP
jgi:hypothetical protein